MAGESNARRAVVGLGSLDTTPGVVSSARRRRGRGLRAGLDPGTRRVASRRCMEKAAFCCDARETEDHQRRHGVGRVIAETASCAEATST